MAALRNKLPKRGKGIPKGSKGSNDKPKKSRAATPTTFTKHAAKGGGSAAPPMPARAAADALLEAAAADKAATSSTALYAAAAAAFAALATRADAEAVAGAGAAARPNRAIAMLHNERGYALEQDGRPREAIEAYSQAITWLPDDLALLWSNRARVEEAVGMYADAVRDYEAALRVSPEWRKAKRRLSAAKGRQAASAALERALNSRDPSQVAAQLEVGRKAGITAAQLGQAEQHCQLLRAQGQGQLPQMAAACKAVGGADAAPASYCRAVQSLPNSQKASACSAPVDTYTTPKRSVARPLTLATCGGSSSRTAPASPRPRLFVPARTSEDCPDADKVFVVATTACGYGFERARLRQLFRTTSWKQQTAARGA